MTYTFKPLRFLAWFVGLTIGLPVLIMLIRETTGFDLNSSAVSIIPIFIAAMQEGIAFAKITKTRPETGQAWRLAGVMTLWAVVASVILAVVQWFVFPDFAQALAQLGRESAVLFAGFTVFYLLALFLSARLFFGLGARNQMKIEQKNG